MPSCPYCRVFIDYLKYQRTIVEEGRTCEGSRYAHEAKKEDIEHEEYMCPYCSAHIADTSEDAQKFLRRN